jgi:hypothetical protein
MVDPNQVIRYVEKNTDLADAVRLTSESAVSGRTTTFKGTRSKADGSTQEVTIEVLDTGARGGSIRYAVSVYPDDGEPIHGCAPALGVSKDQFQVSRRSPDRGRFATDRALA